MKKELSVTVFDVGMYILEKMGKLTSWKLQKLVYYCQAWSLVWDENPLFNEKILAWANGPVVKELYEQHRGKFYVEMLKKGDLSNLSPNQKDTIDHVLEAYGNKSSQWLSDLTHMELPWIEAREGLKPGDRGNAEIQLGTMHEYYSTIQSGFELN